MMMVVVVVSKKKVSPQKDFHLISIDVRSCFVTKKEEDGGVRW